MRKQVLVVIGIVLQFLVYAQELPVPLNMQSAFKKGSRSHSGKPGPAYWQNTADYSIDAEYHPDTRLLSGKMVVDYYNNSPDTLRQIWFKLFPNLYKAGTPSLSKIDGADLGEGLVIDSMWVDGKKFDKTKLSIDGTNMVVGRMMVAKGQKVRFAINYHYTLNKGSHIRTGEIEKGAAFIAYFFPRISVYDDIDGWNKLPYNGRQEFYNDFCNFDIRVRVPGNYIVWATGDLQNPADLFQQPYRDRLAEAGRSDRLVTIIDSSELGKPVTKAAEWNTWHYKAADVTDFAFAVADHYVWQSSSLVVDKLTGRRTRVDAVFNPKHKDYYWVAPDARKTVEAMSFVFPKWPFPYSHITVFDGLDQMEYPMMVNDNPVESRFESVTLTDHEIFHTMFPFYMGINETKYAWMDEGWATIGEWLISPLIDSTIVDDYGVSPTEKHFGTEADLPVISLSTENNAAYFTNSYPEPAMAYLFVKDMLGDSLFHVALHHYINNWKGKHPIPLDFFNSMNQGSGKNLNWFWKKWFYETGYADLSIKQVVTKLHGYKIVVENKGNKPVPIDLQITYVDKTTYRVHRTVAVWQKANVVEIPLNTSGRIESIRLGSTWIPDADKKDNVYTASSPVKR